MMCEECEEFPAQYVAYFNKAGGKLWRPAQKAPTAWAIDIKAGPVPQSPAHGFVCDGSAVPTAAAADDEEESPQSQEHAEIR